MILKITFVGDRVNFVELFVGLAMFQIYTHSDDHTQQTSDTPGFKSFYYNTETYIYYCYLGSLA